MKKEKKFLGIHIAEDLKTYNFVGIYLICAILMLAYMIPTIALPRFLKETIGVGDKNFGTINSAIQIIGSLTNIFFLGYVGFLSDRFGRKILLSYGMLCAALSFIIYSLPPYFSSVFGISPLLFVFIFHFFFSLSMTFAFPQMITITADYTNFKSRGKAMAVASTMMGIGVTGSFFIFSKLQDSFGVLSLFFIGAGVCFVTFLIAKFMVVDRFVEKHKKNKETKTSAKQNWKIVLEELKTNKGLTFCIVSTFPASVDRIILGIFIFIWAVQSAPDYGLSHAKATAMAGIVVGLSSLCALISTPFWGIAADRISRMPIVVLGLFLKGTGFLLIGFSSSPFSLQVKLAGILTGLGVAAVSVGTTTLTADLSPKKILGSVLGVSNTVGSLGTLTFVQLGGIIFDWISHSSPFALVGIADAAALIYGLSVWKDIPKINKHSDFRDSHY
ncbi:MAG: MFS transporter [Candidatus Schekmanbacteria bacterium]|nr:MAG: MFS transporter [Candidatus Schekmanbacteria bacterium]